MEPPTSFGRGGKSIAKLVALSYIAGCFSCGKYYRLAEKSLGFL
jgi:hypothetical protein